MKLPPRTQRRYDERGRLLHTPRKPNTTWLDDLKRQGAERAAWTPEQKAADDAERNARAERERIAREADDKRRHEAGAAFMRAMMRGRGPAA